MLRQSDLWRVLGRRLTERLIRAGWIEPIRENRRVSYSARSVHRALSRVQNEGYLLSGRVRSVSVFPRGKMPKRPVEETLANLELDNLFPE
jgi:hypothetical protein